MGFFDTFSYKWNSNRANDEELEQIEYLVDYITDSDYADDSESRYRLVVRRYTDYTFSVVKTYIQHPRGHVEVSRSIILRNDKRVYNGNSAVRLDLWFDHLWDVYEMIKSESYQRRR